MNAAPDMTLPAGCPWADYSHATIHYCEDNLCAWITQPANTWSNLGFVLVGLWLTYRAKQDRSPYLKLIGPIAVVVGLTSFWYHASFSFVAQVFDLSSMYCFSALLLVMNLLRLGALAPARVAAVFTAIVVVTTGLVVAFRVIGIPVFAVQLAAALELERRIRARGEPTRYAPFLLALGIFATSFGFWILDTTRIWCDPTGHVVQGHAIWHVLNAFVFVALYRFYSQFQLVPRAPSLELATR